MADYIIAYDITDPKRLGRIHRALVKVAVPIQYSVFLLSSDPRQVMHILAGLASLIDHRSDDLRCYPLPARGLKLRLGKATFPTGIHYTDMPEPWAPDT